MGQGVRRGFAGVAGLGLVLAAAWWAIGRSVPSGISSTTDAPRSARGLKLDLVAEGFRSPVYLTAPAGDSRLFVVEQPGRVRVIQGGRVLARPFLDISGDVSFGGERGLLGLAFHPRYAQNGLFFLNYTDRSGDTRIERFRVGRDPNVADVASRKLVLRVEQPYSNHNGGHVLFGEDGMLYVGMGDGGSGGDPHGNGQDRSTLLGDLLRLDVDRGDPYAIPPDNPFAGQRGMRGEIWAWGLRNPWRFCFDAEEDLLYIADVGQNRWEEIDVVPSRRGGLNFGWNRMEGAHCYRAPGCDQRGLTGPAVEYGHDDGCSITGGFVYRGRAMPDLRGHYFYADYCSGWVRSFRWREGRATDHREWELGRVGAVTSFGLDSSGEIHVLVESGRVFRLALASRRSG